MDSAEQSSSNLGPRYAPDDPTLPEPWKGLIDGSTGLMYYWNPETNVTQYERPASFTPPLKTGRDNLLSNVLCSKGNLSFNTPCSKGSRLLISHCKASTFNRDQGLHLQELH
ncbi:hypothetical protein M569_07831 [Genlisea aurea]|uniref:WW domain-containing protein n=1 Tax=Genlisea aurea TaxID=192259 RepID=S8CIX1_9LAMI|nr:hypothetical protein M569_07831 [Genlisea aurea]